MSAGARTRLGDVEVFQISRAIAAETLGILQAFGRRRLEGLVLWVGKIEGRTATVTDPIVPSQHPLQREDGLGYFVASDELHRLNVTLSSAGLRLLAQVHSHPGAAYHSDADDRYAIVTTEGGLSLVVPNFGNTDLDPSRWAVYRLEHGRWHEVELPRILLQVC